MYKKFYTVKFCLMLWNFVKISPSVIKYDKISSSTGKYQKIQLNSIKLYVKLLLNMSWLVEKGAFEHKCVLDFISLTFVHAKWTKSKPTFVQTFNKVWPYFTKVFLQQKLFIFTKFHPVLSRSWLKSFALYEYHSYLLTHFIKLYLFKV